MKLEQVVDRENFTQDQATESAIDAMRTYARKDVAEVGAIAIPLTRELADSKSKMIALRNFVLSNLQYVYDETEAKSRYNVSHPEGVELVKSPLAVLESGTYDCDCIATLLASMLMSLGITCRFAVVGFYSEAVAGPGAFEHVFVQGCCEDGEWFTVDPVSYPDERKMLDDTRQYKYYEI
jgi:transglutaminase-like putative cysteine protease